MKPAPSRGVLPAVSDHGPCQTYDQVATSYAAAHSGTRPQAGKPSLQARVLAFIAVARRGVDFDDLRHAVEFEADGDYELCSALRELIRAGRIACRLASVRYRQGERCLRRDVAVYYLAGRQTAENGGEA